MRRQCPPPDAGRRGDGRPYWGEWARSCSNSGSSCRSSRPGWAAAWPVTSSPRPSPPPAASGRSASSLPGTCGRRSLRFAALSDGPLAVNLLHALRSSRPLRGGLRGRRRRHLLGRPKRRTAKAWMHQCGSVEEASAARAAGADAVIAQGVEAGGHVRGTTAAMELLARVRAALPGNYRCSPPAAWPLDRRQGTPRGRCRRRSSAGPAF